MWMFGLSVVSHLPQNPEIMQKEGLTKKMEDCVFLWSKENDNCVASDSPEPCLNRCAHNFHMYQVLQEIIQSQSWVDSGGILQETRKKCVVCVCFCLTKLVHVLILCCDHGIGRNLSAHNPAFGLFPRVVQYSWMSVERIM